jgi:phosphoglycolate phosphatase
VAVPLLVAAAAEHGHAFDGASVLKGELFKPRLQAELDITLAEAESIYATYVRFYHDRAASHVRPRVGAVELVRTLHGSGVGLALVTNKFESLARAVLAGIGLTECFPVVMGNDSAAFRKPDARVAFEALERLGGRVEQAAFVGDTPVDMECGAAAGVHLVIGVLGTSSAEDLRASGATHVCKDLDAVLSVIAGQAR